MNQPLPAPDEIGRAVAHWNAGQRLRGAVLGTFGLSALALVWVATALDYPFSAIASLAVSAWFGLYGVFLLRRTVLAAPKLAYGALGALALASLALVAVEFRLDPPASGNMPRSVFAPMCIVILGGRLYLGGLRTARRLGPAPQPAARDWLETAFDGPESGALALVPSNEEVRLRRLPDALLMHYLQSKQIDAVERGAVGFRAAEPGRAAELFIRGFPQPISIEPAEAEALERWLRG